MRATLTVDIPYNYVLLPLQSVKLEIQKQPLSGRLLSKKPWRGVGAKVPFFLSRRRRGKLHAGSAETLRQGH